MDIRYETLVFKCQVPTTDVKELSSVLVTIVFFDIEFNTWSVLLSDIQIKNGVLNYTYTIPKRIPSSDTQTRKVRDSIYEGSIPMFQIRLSDSNASQLTLPIPKVTATVSKLQITLDFGILPFFKSSGDTNTTKITEKEEQPAALEQPFTAIDKGLELTYEKETALEKYTDSASEQELIKNLELTKQLGELQKNMDTALAEKNSLAESVAMLEQQTKGSEATIADLNSKLVTSNTTLAHKNAEITNLNQVLAQKEQELVDAQNKIKDLESFYQTENTNKVPTKNVFQSIVNDISTADEQMDSSRFALTNVSMNLKATVEKGPEGTVLGLLDANTAKDINSAAISDISIQIAPNKRAVTNTQGGIPDVLGFTESAVRNLLTKYELKLDVIYQPTEDPNLIEGQSFKQFPEAGTPLVKDQEVTVIFSKPLKN